MAFAHHTHISPPIKIIGPTGMLKYKTAFVYNAPYNIPGPDQNLGHSNNINGDTVFVPAGVGDLFPDVTLHGADAPAPTLDSGSQGRLVKDSASHVREVTESSTASTATDSIWRRKSGVGSARGLKW